MKKTFIILAVLCALICLFFAGTGLALSIDFDFSFVHVLKNPLVYGPAAFAAVFALCAFGRESHP